VAVSKGVVAMLLIGWLDFPPGRLFGRPLTVEAGVA
jgi:hypothetical protein